MSDRDPYAEQHGRYASNPRYDESEADFNPYVNQQQKHQTYESGDIGPSYEEYRDDPQPNPHAHGFTAQPPLPETYSFEGGDGMSRHPTAFTPPTVPPKERPAYDQGGFLSDARPRERTAQALRNYRYEYQGNLWAKGGRGRCIGRFCCCTLMIVLFLLISIVLSLALWIRPPNISINDVGPRTTGSTIQLQSDEISINLGVNISVNNPNYFDVNLAQIKAEIFYPINNTNVGGGTEKNIVFESHSQKNFTFPFAINYKLSLDPNRRILADLANKCGVTGSKSNINVNYKITLGIRILFITISPTVSNSFSFECPMSPSDIEEFLKNANISLDGLLGPS